MNSEITVLKNFAIVTRKVFAVELPRRNYLVIRVFCEGGVVREGVEISYTTLEEALSDYERLTANIKINMAERDNAIRS